MCQMLLSINPEHVENILSGVKKIEFRKVRCKSDVNKIIIYATAPQKMVVGEAEIEEIIEDDINKVWALSLIHISEPTRHTGGSRMPSSA